MGLRLVGIDGQVIHDKGSLIQSLNHLFTRTDIAIILITNKLIELAPDFISELKLKNHRQPYS